jgi:hypothetical protein
MGSTAPSDLRKIVPPTGLLDVRIRSMGSDAAAPA